jgi:hypothetical protein
MKCKGLPTGSPLTLQFRELSRTTFLALDFPKINFIVITTKELAVFVTLINVSFTE